MPVLLRVSGLLALLPASASALVIQGSAGAVAGNVDLSIAGLINLQTGDLGALSGTAPPAFNLTNQGLPINATAGLAGIINLATLTGVGNTSASSTVTVGATGDQSSNAAGEIVGLGLAVADLPGFPVNPPPLLQISADAIGTTCSVTGNSGHLTEAATFKSTNLVVRVSGVAVNLNLPPIISPNTSVDLNALGLAGVVLHLNEQTVTGNGIGTRSIACVALRVEITALSVGALGLVKGSVLVGESSASLVSDADSDGIPDGIDLDSDNDGVPDAVENAKALNGGDTDSDGVPDFLDLDSDNDGIFDVNEAGHASADTNNDGRIDGAPAAFGANGLANAVETAPESGVLNYTQRDTDGDGRDDRVDLDSDNDSISDLLESGNGSLEDDNHDGLVDGAANVNGVIPGAGSSDPVDTDSDGIPDSRDPDSDNDGVNDITDNGFKSLDPNGDGKIDLAGDADGDGIADGLDTLPGVFGGFPLAGCTQWLAANPVDTDGDAVPISQEYALGGNPLSGSGTVSGLASSQGLVLFRSGSAAAGTEKVNASVIRPQGRYDVTFQVQGSVDLASWTDLSLAPVITSNGDGTDTLTWADLQAVSPMTPDAGFVRLMISTPCHPVPSASLAQGWHRLAVAGRRQTVGVQFTGLSLFSGRADNLTGGVTLTTASAGGADLSGLLSGGVPVFLEFTDGTAKGQRFDISSGGVNSLVLNPSGPYSTSASVPGGIAGSHFVVRRHRSLGEVFPNGDWQNAFSAGSADQILLRNSSGYDVYFNYTNPGNSPIWVKAGSTANANATVIPPGAAVFVVHANPDAVNQVLQLGSVRYNDFVCPLPQGLNFVTSGFPVDGSPASLGMTAANGFTSSFSPGSASQIQLWNGDASLNATGYVTAYLAGSAWRVQGSPGVNLTSTNIFLTARGAFLEIRSSNPLWTHTLPYNPAPWVQP